MCKQLASTCCSMPEALQLGMLRLARRLQEHRGLVKPQPECGYLDTARKISPSISLHMLPLPSRP